MFSRDRLKRPVGSIRVATWLALTIAAFLLTAQVGHAATLSTWNGSTGNWNDPTRWSTNPFFPNNGNGAALYDAVIGAGSVDLNTDVSLASLSLNGGLLNGSGTLTTSTLTINNGATLATTGTINATTINLTGAAISRNLTLPATAGNTMRSIGVGAGFALTVPTGSTLTATTGAGDVESVGPGTLINQGTFLKTGISRYYMSLPMNNDGDVQVLQNNLRLNDSGNHTGTFEVVSGQLELAGSQFFAPSATISGNGGLLTISGTATINSEVSTNYLRMVNGTLAGTGNLHPDHFTFDGGTIGRNLTLPTTAGNTMGSIGIGSGFTLTVPAGSTLTATTGAGDVESVGPGTLINQGTFLKTGIGRYYVSMPMNNNGDVQVLENNLRLNNSGTHTGTFEVTNGQLELAGTQTLQPSATVSGAGGLLVISGTATINSEVSTNFLRMVNGTLTGSGNLHPDHYTFDGGTIGRNLTLPTTTGNTMGSIGIGSGFTLTVPAGSTLTATTGGADVESVGPGTLINQGTFLKTGISRFYVSMPMNNEGDVQVLQNNLRLNNSGTHTGTFEVTTGQLELAGTQLLQPSATVTGAGGLLIISGTSTINSDVSTNFIRLVNGTLTGSGNLHPNFFTINAGTLARDLILPTAGPNTIQSLGISSGFTLTNPTGAQLGATSGTVNGPGSFINQGTITKTGAGTETFATFLNQAVGTVNVQAGTLSLTGGGTQLGTFNVSNGATLNFGGQPNITALTTGTLITGAGKVSVGQGTLNVPAGGGNNYAGGTTVGSGGRINITGSGTALGPATATISSGGVLSIEAVNNLLAAQALVQAGGALAVRNDFVPQSLIAPASAGVLAIDTLGFATPVDLAVLGGGSMSLGSTTTGTYTASSLGAGAGSTYRLGGGGGSITLTQSNVLVGDHPLLVIGPGTTTLAANQSYTGTTTVDLAGKLNLQGDLLGGGTVTVRAGATLMGEGTVTGATTIANTGVVSPGHSPGVLSFSGGLTMQSGSHYNWELSAMTTLNPGSSWDQINLIAGQLGVQSGARLDPKFIGTVTNPNLFDPFWYTTHVWHNIINLTGSATNPTGFVNFTIDNSSWSQSGFFAAAAAQSGLGIDLIWTPVPEPSAWFLLATGSAGLWLARIRWRRNQR